MSPTPSKYGTPEPITSPVPYVISSATTIETDPTITTNGVTDYGKIYRGPTQDGPVSAWLFTATSPFDTEIGIDSFFSDPNNLQLAALKFLALSLTGNPTITIGDGGATKLALVSVGDITSGPPGGTLTFSGLDLLLLATQNGSITLTSDLAFQNIQRCSIYARGAESTLTFDSTVSGTTDFGLFSEGSILLNNELSVTETNVSGSQLNAYLQSGGDFTASNGLTINLDNSGGGVLNSSTEAQLTTGGNLTLNGETGLSLTISNNGAGQISDDASLDVSTGGDLTASAINLLINNRDSGSIDGDGTVSTNVSGALATTGDATFVISGRDDGGGAGSISGDASVILTAGSANIGGSLIAGMSAAAGGQLASALATINVTGDVTTGGGLQFSVQNGGFDQVLGEEEGGGIINQDVFASLTATNVTTGDFLTGLISNLDGGQIGGSAALGLALTGNLSSQGDVTFQIDNSTSMGTLFSTIGSDATIGVSVAGNLSANSENGLNLTISNNNNGQIGGMALANVVVGGTLTATAANLVIDNSNGGSIGSSVGLDLFAGQSSINGNLETIIANNSGGSILGSSALLASFTGDLSTGGETDFIIDNSAFSDFGFTVGGDIAQDAAIGLIAQNISTGSGLYTFLYNDGGGHIGGAASIAAAIFGNLTTQGDLFFDIQNSADPGQDGTLPGGTIEGDAAVGVAVSGNIVSHGVGEFAVLNNDYRFLDQGGTILGDASVGVSAAGITTSDFFQPLINNTNGSIDGDATVSVIASGDINVGTETFFNILNTGAEIGGDALANLTANNFTNGDTFEFQILNDGGSIGGNAALTANLAGSLTSSGAATIQITNGGGAIGGDATISLTATALSAPSLLAQIDSLGGTISGAATIDFNLSESLTTTGDATFNIDLTPGGQNPTHAIRGRTAAIGTVDFNGGSYDVGGTLLATIVGGDGGITIGTAAMHADIVKIGAFGNNGSLTIGGGSISGDTLLKLYATGSNGIIDFVSNVTLNSNSSSVIIAGNTVTIHNGVIVTITGDDGVPASVYANVPNYTGSGGNGTTSGMFAGNGATTQALDQAPPFGPATPDTPAKGSTTSIATTAPTDPGLPGNGGSRADTIVHRVRPHVAIARVADSNELLDLADRIVAGPTQKGQSNSNAPAGKTARGPGSVALAKGRPLSPAPKVAPAKLTLNNSGGRRPALLP